MANKTVNHWGKWVESETPVAGVISNNNVEWINEACDSGIDLHYEEYTKENPDEDTEFYEDDSPVYLIGDWKKDENGKYEEDKTGESGYAAIVSFNGFNCTQVIWSKWTKKGALCSPCFPGQVDLDSDGDFLGYTLPDDLIGFDNGKYSYPNE